MMPFKVLARVKAMTRETKLGLLVSCSFLCLLGVVLVLKMTERPEEELAGEVAAAAPNPPPPESKPAPSFADLANAQPKSADKGDPPLLPDKLGAKDIQLTGATNPPTSPPAKAPPPSTAPPKKADTPPPADPVIPFPPAPPAPPLTTPAVAGAGSAATGDKTSWMWVDRLAPRARLTGDDKAPPGARVATTDKGKAGAGNDTPPLPPVATPPAPPPLPPAPVPAPPTVTKGDGARPPLPDTKPDSAKPGGGGTWLGPVARLAGRTKPATEMASNGLDLPPPPPSPTPTPAPKKDTAPLPDLPSVGAPDKTDLAPPPPPVPPKKDVTAPPPPPLPPEKKDVAPPPPPPPDLPPAGGPGKVAPAVVGIAPPKPQPQESVPSIDVKGIDEGTGGKVEKTPIPAAPVPKPVEPKPVAARTEPAPDPIVVGGVPSATVPPLSLRTPPAPAAVRSSRPDVVSYTEESYVAADGDTFRSISKAKYGTEAYAHALYLFNRSHPLAGDELLQSDALRGRQTVYVPPHEILDSRYAGAVGEAGVAAKGGVTVDSTSHRADMTAAAPRTYRVAAGGEKVYDIARRLLGDGNRWVEIQKLNPGWNWEGPLPAGTALQVPADARVP